MLQAFQGADTRWENVFRNRLLAHQISQAIGRREGMAPVGALKVLLATRPRALLRSTLTAPTSAKKRR